ncbi:alpha/beta-hydrolase [Viridothelium virens]|uniref:Alpha/beta-hydrolase n=1 Tax=Viridothelium virens TaxID=1048519 RepID=A0A6A6HNM9_VIRVR|nr:alpha/beta-hydrolase [Viridothelium virens]
MTQFKLSEEWKLACCISLVTELSLIDSQFERNNSVSPPPTTIDDYQIIKAQRGALAQECLKRDAFKPLVDDVQVENLKISLPEVVGHRFPIRIYRPSLTPEEKLPIMLYFHGGYWCAGDANSEDLGCRAIIARGSEVIIVSFFYRPVTDVPWHTVFSDAEYAMKWLASSAQEFGGDTSQGFLIGGAESGAHLAALCAVRARNRYPNIRLTGQVLIVPTLIAWPDPQIPRDWADRLKSHVEHADDPVLNETLYEKLVEKLNVFADARRDGDNFPMWADLRDLPPTYLAMDECDPTRDQGFLYEALLSEAGVRTRTDFYPGLPNMFVQFPDLPTTAIAGFHLSVGVSWLLNPGT